RATEGKTMSERGRARTLRIAMWVLIVVGVPLYLVWLAWAGYRAGIGCPTATQHGGRRWFCCLRPPWCSA
ncbi:hypothetical protein, partial [Streptomyces sp. NPDC051636]|uniref:hypothetical protein n=1 Tax=Streptomyces sp. NPDC051636 TaxID=3365663 RepID=UPI0037A78097